jgi:hypothetical protein
MPSGGGQSGSNYSSYNAGGNTGNASSYNAGRSIGNTSSYNPAGSTGNASSGVTTLMPSGGGQSTAYANVSATNNHGGAMGGASNNAPRTDLAVLSAAQVMMRKFTNFESVYHIYHKFTSIYW